MKELENDKETLWPSTEQVEKSREELWNRIDHEALECALRLPPVGYLIRALNVDSASFRRFWLQPLLAAGATLDVALVCIAQSHFLPN
jgi:hypothetical protein